MPKDLTGVKNGQLPDKLLVPIKPFGKMHKIAAIHWEAMRLHAEKDGIKFTHVGDYRPYEAQVNLFKERYRKAEDRDYLDPAKKSKGLADPKRITRNWEGQLYLLKNGFAPAGTPATSNHGWGLAIDVALVVNGKTQPITSDPDGKGGFKDGVEWLKQHADDYGFSWEVKDGAQAEAWHIRYHVGDGVPPYLKTA